MKLHQLISAIVLLCIAIYGGLKGYIYYNVKTHLDDAITQARPFADIDYAGISSDLSGAVSIDGIRITPLELQETVRIDRVTVRGPDLQFLLGIKEETSQGHLPEQLDFDFAGLRLPLDGEYLAGVAAAQQDSAKALGIELPPCSIAHVLGPKDYATLGINSLRVDAHLGYHFNTSQTGIVLEWGFNSHGMEAANASVTIAGITPNIGNLLFANPGLERLLFNYRMDSDSTRQTLDQCAAQRGIERAEYIAQLVNDSDEAYWIAMGMVPGQGIREAIGRLLAEPGEVEIRVEPYEPINMQTLQLYQPDQLADLLGLSVSVNGTAVTELDFKLLQKQDRELPQPAWLPRTFEPPVAAKAQTHTPEQQTREPPRFREVEAADLHKFIGRVVRIELKGNRPRNGRLLSIDAGVATIEQRMHGGSLTTSARLSEIAIAEAYY